MGRLSGIRAVFFDFGGVLTAASPFELLGSLGADAGVAPDQVLDIVLGPYHEDTDHPFHQMERGEISGVVWFAQAAEALAGVGVELDPGRLVDLFLALGVHDVVVERVRALRADGYLTGVITNNAPGSGWRETMDVDALFDVIVDSSEVGVRKPNPAIFHLALDLAGGLAPEEAVFLDDAESNVVAARAVGMHGVVVGPDPLPALAELDAILAAAGKASVKDVPPSPTIR